jgi:hypothetical protein
MFPERILVLELMGFVLGLAVIVVFQLLTGHINMRGLLAAKDRSTNVSPERVQLLVLTLSVGFAYINQVSAGDGATLPDIPNNWLYVLGGSSSVYAAGKLWRTFWK